MTCGCHRASPPYGENKGEVQYYFGDLRTKAVSVNWTHPVFFVPRYEILCFMSRRRSSQSQKPHVHIVAGLDQMDEEDFTRRREEEKKTRRSSLCALASWRLCVSFWISRWEELTAKTPRRQDGKQKHRTGSNTTSGLFGIERVRSECRQMSPDRGADSGRNIDSVLFPFRQRCERFLTEKTGCFCCWLAFGRARLPPSR